jgi:hypothetical protein
MKKAFFILSLLISGFVYETASAQLRININIGSQPVWGPVGYDHVDYYYMPDIDAYYYVPNRQYIYLEGNRWTFAYNLPARFNYDIYSGYKVVVNEPQPYRHAEMYRTKYAGYRGNHGQQIIRDSREEKYYEIKDHPEHNKWKKDNGRNDDGRGNRDNGNHKNRGRGRGRD